MVQNHTYRLQRGRILKILYKAFPDGVADDVVSLTLSDMGLGASSGVLKGHCDYLKGKGYIESVEAHSAIESDYIVKLTPRGIDLLEGNIDKDPGIEL